ncbi:MAG: Rieske 2Fe-2S domain-containing protein [Burkholderiales bacterium]|jgi:nitrite reductase/ring-hydroxylating ferredoxin subunit|nr:Rieske 2Fe-2S domain-containing protein [Burkholderiales bacterium]
MNWWRHPDCPPEGTQLCSWDELPVEGGLERVFGSSGDPLHLVVLRAGEDAVCFVNLCPHFSLPLNHEPGRFLTFDGSVVCAHHTAFFQLADGVCTEGPCLGMALERVPVMHRQGVVILGSGSGGVRQGGDTA